MYLWCVAMSTRVKAYLTKEINTIGYEGTITDAVKVMAADENFGGYIIFLKKGKLVGMITERDIGRNQNLLWLTS